MGHHEPDAGSDAFGGMRTTVRRDGDEWVLKGQKTFITNGPYADTMVVYAKHDDGSGIDRRDQPVLTFVLDAGMPGLQQSKPLRKMGMHSSPTGQLFFDDVRLGDDRLLGSASDGGGRESARANFVVERVGIAALSLGVIEECLRLCVDYARSRELWGQPIGDFQLIQLKLAEMEIARVNVRNMVFSSIEQRRAGQLPSLAEASAIKLYSSRAATDVAMEAVQLFGGNGYMAEYRVEQLARDAKSLMIYAGSNEVQVDPRGEGPPAGLTPDSATDVTSSSRSALPDDADDGGFLGVEHENPEAAVGERLRGLLHDLRDLFGTGGLEEEVDGATGLHTLVQQLHLGGAVAHPEQVDVEGEDLGESLHGHPQGGQVDLSDGQSTGRDVLGAATLGAVDPRLRRPCATAWRT